MTPTRTAKAKDAILTAADELIRREGFARLTTKQIARAAGISEASIYYHYADKLDLVQAVLATHLARLLPVTRSLPERAGSGTVAANLEAVATALVSFYQHVIPVAAAAQTDAELLARFRRQLADSGQGPHRGVEVVADYLRAEQRLGRVSAAADPDAAAMLLVGACHQVAFESHLLGTPPPPSADPAALVAALLGLGGLTPQS
ncbi:MAG TPA: helix-turn-helix domain-containing protein [Actinomycetota bacterium]